MLPNQKIQLTNKTLLVLLSYLNLIASQATTDQISTVQTQYDGLFLSSSYPDGFGISLKAQALLNVKYPSGDVTLGKAYSASDVSTQPSITVTPIDSAQSAFKTPNVFTLMLADANAYGNPDPQGNYRHFLENSATFGDASGNGTMALNVGSGTIVTAYAGPGPLPNEGPHRYAWLLFAQPSTFQAPSNLSSAGTGPGHWYLNAYVSSTKLGDLIAASFFTVENGHASFTPKPTPASNTGKSASITNTTHSSPVTATNSPSANAKSHASKGPLSIDFASLVKVISTGLGVAVCGYVLVQ